MQRVIIDKLDSIFCPHCAAKNPKKAYVCLKCLKVMFPKDEVQWWKIRVHPVISFSLILSVVLYSILSFAAHWLTAVEGNLTLNVKTTNYNLNVVADKKKHEPLQRDIDFKSLRNPEEE